MFEEKKEIFNRVYELAKIRRKEYEKKDNGIVVDLLENDENFINYTLSKEELELDNYLNSLDFEDIKILQTIMYLGRDGDYEQDDMPDTIYIKSRRYMDKLGWTDKEIEANQMLEKIPLDEYLENGFKILNIKL